MSVIIVPVGLPACGKTTYLQKLQYRLFNTLLIPENFCNSLEELFQYIHSVESQHTTILVDGLFLSSSVHYKFVREFNEVRFIYWEPNISNSLYNDKKRNRPTLADISIKHLAINKPPKDLTMNTCETAKYTTTYTFILNNIDESFPTSLTSDTWSEGGTWRDCWDNEGTISADTPLNQHNCLIEGSDKYYVKKLCNFFQISPEELNNYNYLLETIDCGEGDYYGGYEERTAWSVSSELLVNEILKKKYNLTEEVIPQLPDILPELFI